MAGVFKIAEKEMSAVVEFSQIDRVIPDVALRDDVQHLRPDGGVELFVFTDFVWIQADDGTVALHSDRLWVVLWGLAIGVGRTW